MAPLVSQFPLLLNGHKSHSAASSGGTALTYRAQLNAWHNTYATPTHRLLRTLGSTPRLLVGKVRLGVRRRGKINLRRVGVILLYRESLGQQGDQTSPS